MKWMVPLVGVLALTGCGSTVQLQGAPPGSSSTVRTSTDGGLTAPSTSAATGATGTSEATGADASAGVVNTGATGATTVPGTATSVRTRGSGSGQSAAAIPSAGRSGFGYTASVIKVGVAVSSSANAAFASFGAKGLAFPDGKQLTNAYVAYLNRTGGIAGRKVVPVFYDYQATGNVQTSDQAACAAWTQDDRVVAALGVRAGASGTDDALTPCLTKAGVAWMSGSGDAQKFASYPQTLYAPSRINSTRLAEATVNALWDAGFFTAGARIGVEYQDNPEMTRALTDGIEPALAAHGLSVAAKAAVSNAFTESSNIELHFATARITHVLFAAPGGAAPWQFMQNAQQNGHHFRYGISSDDQPAIVLQQFAPKQQLATTEGLGYAPTQDVSGSQQPTPALAQCLKVFKDAGFDTSSSTSQYAMSFVCDPFQLLREALARAPELNAPMLAAGVDRLGASFAVAGSFAARFDARQHDGGDAYRLLRYDNGCSCFGYHGSMHRIG